jgi:3-deoxy-D-manno-octulosonic-acid transferase
MGKVNQIFMLLIYNFLQIVLGIFLTPLLLVVVLLTPKYREMVRRRSGSGLKAASLALPGGGPRIWVHALSVGEVSSARAMVRAIKHQYPDGVLLFSASTRSGLAYAESVVAEDVDLLLPFPFDLYWLVERFIRILRPDLFILVETDLWPNFLASLNRHKVKSLLVNGRISVASANKFQRGRFFFAPLFNVFSKISMQTALDAERMKELGVSEEKLISLGNLKYGVIDIPAVNRSEVGAKLPEGRLVLLAGSTHAGEEEILLEVYDGLRESFPDLFLVIAPRDVGRSKEIAKISEKKGLRPVLRSVEGNGAGDLMILDTLGELAGLYSRCVIAFVGGSLVNEGGHNPLEPAARAKPVIFGPHMEDFGEVAEDLLRVGGAVRVADQQSMADILSKWLTDQNARLTAGECAAGLVRERQEVTARHLELIKQLIAGREYH